ncbi:MAG TPA: NAD(+) diphosphatase [Dermatophilaceae bacterium]|nr:NAD(+) diphosphatase [Dermatophilaceae bacterium]
MPAAARSSHGQLGPLPLARAALDRDAERRLEPDLFQRLLGDPRTRVLGLRGSSARTDGDLNLLLRPPLPTDRDQLVVYLGRDGDHTAYLGVVEAEPDDGVTGGTGATLRELGPLLTDRDAGLFTTLLALANWHATHTHCPQCGTPTEATNAGWVRRCPADGSDHYPRTDPAVIVAVVDAEDRLLLARGPAWPERSYSVLAGFVEPGEPLEAAVHREVREEVGVELAEVTYLGNQPWPFPCSLMVGFTARATSTELRPADPEIQDATWLTRTELQRRLRDGSLLISGRLSIARALVEHWYGGRLAPPTEQVTARG